VNLVYRAERSSHSVWRRDEQWMVRVHLKENSALRASTAKFLRRRALARTGKPVNEQDPWTLYHWSHAV
jgi:hypothetical protein